MLMTPDAQDLPPVEAFAIKQSSATGFEHGIDSAMALRLSGELVDAEDTGARATTPVFVDIPAGKSQVDYQIPAGLTPRPVPRRIVGMEKKDLHNVVNENRMQSRSVVQRMTNAASNASAA